VLATRIRRALDEREMQDSGIASAEA